VAVDAGASDTVTIANMKHAAALALQRGLVVTTVGFGTISSAGTAAADDVGYLVNVTVRPYHFADATAALAYGRRICAAVEADRPYRAVMADVMADQATTDEYQASYLITQATEELCPALISQLRSSAADYQS
jgi:hypothetical protein